jgi:EAL domain-containing protein (putative c-di-GMP-specific phosphodiesterase class I)
MDAQIYDGAVILQISERVAQEQLKQAQVLLENLQRIHTTLLIDGVGLSEPANQLLSRLKATWVKLDRGLVESIAKQKANQTRLLESIKMLKQHEGLEVIVPHIENAAALQIASMSGADYLQGNFIQGLSDRLDFDFSSF